MSSRSRANMLARLSAVPRDAMDAPETDFIEVRKDRDELIRILRERVEAVGAEVYETAKSSWIEELKLIFTERKIARLLYAPRSDIGRAIESLESGGEGLPELVPYDRDIDESKEELFEIEAGVTSVRSAIADIGALVLWPTPDEPCLMSLTPRTHIALLDADAIHPTFEQAIRSEDWAADMPAKAILVSGPSKTADIAGHLVRGIHGPKSLVVIVLR